MKHKHAELIKAWADGAEIEQCCRNGLGEILWYPFKGDWQEHYEYRIKPQEETHRTYTPNNKYLYVYNSQTRRETWMSEKQLDMDNTYGWTFMGKVEVVK